MPDETKKDTTTQSETTTPTRDGTQSGSSLTTDENEETESSDAPYQGKRSTGGYVPT
jgi:hypothetical protein